VTTPASTPSAQSATIPARTSGRSGTLALWVAAAPLLAAPTILAFFTGGTDARAHALTTVGALGLLGLVAIAGRWPLVEASWPLAALGALAAFAGWVALSVSWAPVLGQAVDDVDRAVAYCALFGLAVAVLREPAIRRVAPDALLAGVTVVALYALSGRLFPDVVEQASSRIAGDRLHQPVGYWNAMGILTGFGVVLGVAVAGSEARARWWRASACAAAVGCGLACMLTFSRGAWLATVGGLAVAALVRPRRPMLAAGGLALGACVLLGAALQAFPAVLEVGRSGSARTGQGLVFAVIALAVAAAAALAFERLARRPAGGTARAGRTARARAIVAVPLLMLAAGVAVSLSVEQTEQISRGAERVATLKTQRGDYWRVALESFAEHPVAGVGTGGFHVEWWRERDSDQFAYDAHSLYLETLAELGLVGGVALLGFAACVALGLRRRWRAVPDDPLLAAAAGVLAAFAVHAGLDWDWEVPAVTTVALLLAAAAIQRPDPAETA
jgi:O-antigen ligase